MRFTAVRPVKRGSIFFGKYFAIMIMSAILLLFGTITSLIVGGILIYFKYFERAENGLKYKDSEIRREVVGKISKGGASIVCLPHKVIVRIEGGDSGLDAAN